MPNVVAHREKILPLWWFEVILYNSLAFQHSSKRNASWTSPFASLARPTRALPFSTLCLQSWFQAQHWLVPWLQAFLYSAYYVLPHILNSIYSIWKSVATSSMKGCLLLLFLIHQQEERCGKMKGYYCHFSLFLTSPPFFNLISTTQLFSFLSHLLFLLFSPSTLLFNSLPSRNRPLVRKRIAISIFNML